jgi:hypothetical protein
VNGRADHEEATVAYLEQRLRNAYALQHELSPDFFRAVG